LAQHRVKRFPTITVAVIALSIIATFIPSILVYDRERIIAGELWRIFTCNLVHFSISHFAYNALIFGWAGWFIEARGYRGFGWLCAFCPPVVGGTVFVAHPDLQIVGGLSGMATAAFTLLALHGLREPRPWPYIALVALGAMVIKFAFEFWTDELFFARSSTVLMKPVTEGHVAGAVCSVVIWFLSTRPFDQRRSC
jgi:rhomboid family GlyGly-CTERM serine protease